MLNGIINFFKNLFKNPLIVKFNEFLKEVFKAEKPLLMGALSEIAKLAVKDLTFSTLTNEEKRKAAFAKIKEEAKAKALETSDSMINLAIEMAVQTLKG